MSVSGTLCFWALLSMLRLTERLTLKCLERKGATCCAYENSMAVWKILKRLRELCNLVIECGAIVIPTETIPHTIRTMKLAITHEECRRPRV